VTPYSPGRVPFRADQSDQRGGPQRNRSLNRCDDKGVFVSNLCEISLKVEVVRIMIDDLKYTISEIERRVSDSVN
jgi:hypothetical protein